MEEQLHWAIGWESKTFQIAYVVLILSTISFLIELIFGSKPIGKAGKALFYLGTFSLTASIVFRTMITGRLPLISLFEVFLALSWMMLLIALFTDLKIKKNFCSTFTGFFAAVTLIYISGPGGFDTAAGPRVPALQSAWLEFHVATTMLGYAAFAVAFLSAEAYLINKLEWLEELSYKLSTLGFPFLTIGILSGAVWAQEAWGTWWGWDPKETASLIMWLVYAAYLHMRHVRGWRGTKAAWMNIIGFLTMLFCFMGLNWLGTIFEFGGMHEYSSGSEKMAYFLYMIIAISVVVLIGGFLVKFREQKQNQDKDKK